MVKSDLPVQYGIVAPMLVLVAHKRCVTLKKGPFAIFFCELPLIYSGFDDTMAERGKGGKGRAEKVRKREDDEGGTKTTQRQ